MTQACEHGATSNWWWESLGGGAWAGGLSKCNCCYAEFGYIDMASYSSKGGHTSKTWTKDRCERCGGHYVDYGFEPITEK